MLYNQIKYSDYPDMVAKIAKLKPDKGLAACRYLCRHDLYFLLRYALNRHDIDHPWLFERCREVQNEPDEHLDLWAREHGKSSVITFGKTIQDILASHGNNPLPEWAGKEATFGIFSHTRPIAKSFLTQIMRELEQNRELQKLFPDILYSEPRKQSPRWSQDGGIVVKRKSNPAESTVEAWGLVDGQPTGRHFVVLIYDDVVTRESVTTPEQIEKTTEALALSYNLGQKGGKKRFIGTRYHFNDTYRELMDRGTVIPRLHPATKEGTVDGNPVLLTKEELAGKYRDQGPYVFACQQLLNPVVASNEGFQRAWLRYWKNDNILHMNLYIVVDPAHSKKKGSDFTVMWVIGLAQDEKYYLIDGIRDRLNLQERANALIRLHRKYRPMGVAYERYGLQADIQHIEYVQGRQNYRFDIVECGGSTPKIDRIKGLQPLFASGRFFLPASLPYLNTEGETRNLIKDLIDQEYIPFPVPVYDDGLDCMARILDDDLQATFPMRHYDMDMDIQPEMVEAY